MTSSNWDYIAQSEHTCGHMTSCVYPLVNNLDMLALDPLGLPYRDDDIASKLSRSLNINKTPLSH